MSQRPVCIIGAGISGLVLGRCLLHRDIPAVIYERDTLHQATNRHTYGITLHRSAYEPLLNVLGLEESVFRRKVAVDASIGGNGYVSSEHDETILRANRRWLEVLLREGLDVRWEHELAGFIPLQDSSHGIVVGFTNGLEAQGSLVVGADGPRSRVRHAVSPASEFKILPYAVYNGKRRISRAEFDAKFAAHLDEVNVIEHRIGETLLQISLNDVNETLASINYVYSRPNAIPEELFDEVGLLTELAQPFSNIFQVEAMRHDRLLNWLMRSVLVPRADLHSAAASGIVLLGDAAHHAPVLSSMGADEAINDAVHLAQYIAETGGQSLKSYCKSKHGGWAEYVATSEAQLATMHGSQSSPPRL
ncbi:hypothetical protein LTR85_001413 [Meristemomyces frigidus]|nr:hypothetical protein LTR85_001413 [Meristemomyces frigidus]